MYATNYKGCPCTTLSRPSSCSISRFRRQMVRRFCTPNTFAPFSHLTKPTSTRRFSSSAPQHLRRSNAPSVPHGKTSPPHSINLKPTLARRKAPPHARQPQAVHLHPHSTIPYLDLRSLLKDCGQHTALASWQVERPCCDRHRSPLRRLPTRIRRPPRNAADS